MKITRLFQVCGLFLMGALWTACGPAAPAPTATPPPRDDTAVRAALAEGVHGDTYSLGTGPNTYCAQCKSPRNYDPKAVIDAPPNCVSCKFDSDAQMRVAVGNPVVPENEWQGIRCTTCHEQPEGAQVNEAVAWWDPLTDTYLPQDSSTQLCEQCHRDSERGTMRRREMAESAIHTEATCTTCHDPHSGAASCSDCHNESDTETAFIEKCFTPYLAEGAEARHTDMLCEACHDNGGLEARPVEDPNEPYLGQWATWRSGLIAGVIPTNHVWVSHNLAREVNCDRCHFADNPWGLSDKVTSS